MGDIGGKVVAPYLHGLRIVCRELFPFQHGFCDPDDLCLAVGLLRNGGQGDKGNNGCQQDTEQAEDKAVIQFHGCFHSCHIKCGICQPCQIKQAPALCASTIRSAIILADAVIGLQLW